MERPPRMGEENACDACLPLTFANSVFETDTLRRCDW